MKVLIVDDDPMVQRIAAARLKKENLEIASADCGRQGLQAAAEEKPDVILLDVDMPDLSGFEVINRLQADPELARIPVIFVTGSADVENKVRGLDLGAVDYVTKPFDPFELRARVKAALRSKRLQDLLVNHAHIDPLTELWNRRALTERMESEWERVQRYGPPLGFIMADLDYFKQLNDRFGHRVGDQVLTEVGRLLKRTARSCDVPCRYGGEEFAILVPEQPVAGTAALAERCRLGLATLRITAGEHRLSPTASFGVADSTTAASPEELIEQADEALYQAKRQGRNAVCIHPASSAAAEPAEPGPVELPGDDQQPREAREAS